MYPIITERKTQLNESFYCSDISVSLIRISLYSTTSGQNLQVPLSQHQYAQEEECTNAYCHLNPLIIPLSPCMVTMAAIRAVPSGSVAWHSASCCSGLQEVSWHSCPHPPPCALSQQRGTGSTGNRANCLLPAVPLATTAVWLEQHQKEDEAFNAAVKQQRRGS